MTKYVACGRSNTRKDVYHTDKDCRRLSKSDVREATTNEVAYFELAECHICKHGNPGAHDIETEWHKINRKLRFGEVE